MARELDGQAREAGRSRPPRLTSVTMFTAQARRARQEAQRVMARKRKFELQLAAIRGALKAGP
jgi:hypothetical protein